MENKETAVNWLLRMLYSPICNGYIHGRRQIPHDIIQQAKSMEKNQMIKFALHLHNVDISKTGTDILTDEAEQYYKITYGKEPNSNTYISDND